MRRQTTLIRNRGETLSGLLSGLFSFVTGAAGAAEKGTLPLQPLLFRPCCEEEEEGSVKACCCDRGTTGETPPWSAEEADEDLALDGPDEDFQGIFGGCNIR